MEEPEKEQVVFIVGHRNPDTDSICSAIAYAYVKNHVQSEELYRACRAGQINEETEYVLNYFGIQTPDYLSNVGMQVRDLDVLTIPGASEKNTVREAWDLMGVAKTMTLPITDNENFLRGLITVDDIATYYMDAYTKTIMSDARTQYRAIAETLDGKVVAGNEHGYFVKGSVLIGAAQPERMRESMGQDDLVILGDREDAQIMAIQSGASCIVICMGIPPSLEVKEAAEKASCVIISTKLDTYTVARLINQSIPIKHLMTTKGIVSFHLDDYIDDIRETMGHYHHSDFPVLDRQEKYYGTISRRSLINIRKKKVILVDHSEISQAVENLDEANILEIIDHHRIGTVQTMQPIFFRGEPVGCTSTIIYRIFHEQKLDIPKKIAGLLCAAIISDTLMFRSPTCTPLDKQAAEELAEIAGIDIESFAQDMFRAGSNLAGKSPEEIFYQDFKKFIFGTTVFGVGQINSMSKSSLSEIKEKMLPFMKQECGKNGITMVYFMLTDILTENTELLYYGENSEELIENSFHMDVNEGSCMLMGVVSRKKQLIPAFMESLQNE